MTIFNLGHTYYFFQMKVCFYKLKLSIFKLEILFRDEEIQDGYLLLIHSGAWQKTLHSGIKFF